jgi:hypothetical protein
MCPLRWWFLTQPAEPNKELYEWQTVYIGEVPPGRTMLQQRRGGESLWDTRRCVQARPVTCPGARTAQGSIPSCVCDLPLQRLQTNSESYYDRRPVGQSFLVSSPVVGLLIQSGLTDERTDLSFTIAVGPHQRSHSRIRVPPDSWSMICCLRFETPPTWRASSLYLYSPRTG